MTDLLGFAGSVASFVLWWPQAARTWRLRHNPEALAGVSAATQWLVVACALIWFVYAATAHAWWSGAPGVINLPLAVTQLALIGRGRRQLAARTATSPSSRSTNSTNC